MIDRRLFLGAVCSLPFVGSLEAQPIYEVGSSIMNYIYLTPNRFYIRHREINSENAKLIMRHLNQNDLEFIMRVKGYCEKMDNFNPDRYVCFLNTKNKTFGASYMHNEDELTKGDLLITSFKFGEEEIY